MSDDKSTYQVIVSKRDTLAYPSDGARHANPNPRLPLNSYVHWERWQPR